MTFFFGRFGSITNFRSARSPSRTIMALSHTTHSTHSRAQPPWNIPASPSESVPLPALKVYNSLTRSKTKFVPIDPGGKKVTWYSCGPTVYDDAHLGHARNYVSTDILRRILKDYFSFDVKFVMNVTDVDDKIILRGRQQHLLQEFRTAHPDIDQPSISTAELALKAYRLKNLPAIPNDVSLEHLPGLIDKFYGTILRGGSLSTDGKPAGDQEAKLKMHIKTVLSAANALRDEGIKKVAALFYGNTEDVFLPYLDSLHGSSIDGSDHNIFTKLTSRYEARFMDDVRALNCLDPDVVTRVTEYGDDIREFVEEIVRNGFGYKTSDGSVYFDIDAFERAGYDYARLEPWNRNESELIAGGEGQLAKLSTEKRSDADFALWKSSKPGEPSWKSDWGPGRPGWHIECSAMASKELGKSFDIHSGGIDLAFPHHDNEIAQSEAHWNCGSQHQWVNYFLHMGHLSIQGSKMSKSLKNFTTIREALSRGDWTPRGLRIVFLLTGWKEGVEIADELVKAGNSWEDKVNNFFWKARDINARRTRQSHQEESEQLRDPKLDESLELAKKDTHTALCDSFDTPEVMRVISELITKVNSAEKAGGPQATESFLEIGRWVTKIVRTFGLDATKQTIEAGNDIGWSGIDIPEAAKPYVYELSALRDDIRQGAIAGKLSDWVIPDGLKHVTEQRENHPPSSADEAPYVNASADFIDEAKKLSSSDAPAKDYLQLCDRLRDVTLWDLGIHLEDREGAGPSPGPAGARAQPALVRPVDRELRAAREEKSARDNLKAQAKAEREAEAARKAEKGKVSQLVMFRTNEYSEWDADGIPTRDATGAEVTKSRAKKLRKDWERQKKLYESWVASGGGVDTGS